MTEQCGDRSGGRPLFRRAPGSTERSGDGVRGGGVLADGQLDGVVLAHPRPVASDVELAAVEFDLDPGGRTGGDRFSFEASSQGGALMLTTQTAERAYASIGAAAEVSVRLEAEGRIATGKGADTDTLVASARAYVSAMNKLALRQQTGNPGALQAV